MLLSYTFKCLPSTVFVFLRALDAEDEAVVFEDGAVNEFKILSTL